MKKIALISVLLIVLPMFTACNSIPAFQYPCCSEQDYPSFHKLCFFAGFQYGSSSWATPETPKREKTIDLSKEDVVFRMELHIPKDWPLENAAYYFTMVWQDDYNILFKNPPPVLLGMVSEKTMKEGELTELKSPEILNVFNRYYSETVLPKDFFAQGTHFFKLYEVKKKCLVEGSIVYGEYTREGDSLLLNVGRKRDWLKDYCEEYYFNEEGEYFLAY